jgi:ABC-2 type transport system ATP-binding protein
LELCLDSRDPAVLNDIPGLLDISFYGYKYRVVVDNVLSASEIIKQHLQQKGIGLTSMGVVSPTMEDVFVALAEEGAVKWTTNTQ